MTESQEKAREIVIKMQLQKSPLMFEQAKKCALICVTEIINANPHSNPLNTDGDSTMAFWMQVKEEINKL